MRAKIFQIGTFYVRVDIASFKYQDDDRLLGFLTCGGMYKACTDVFLKNCKLFRFKELRVGLFFGGLAFGVERELTQQETQVWDQI